MKTTHSNVHGANGGEGMGGGLWGDGGSSGGGGDGGMDGGGGVVGGAVYVYVLYPEQWQQAISGVTSTANRRSVRRMR